MDNQRTFAALAVALVALAGCVGGDNEETEGSTQTSTTAAAAPATDPATSPPSTGALSTTVVPTTTTAGTTTTPTTAAPTTAPPTTSATTTTTTPPVPALPAGFTIAIPVDGGDDGLTYSEALVEQEVTGPTSISVDDHGSIFIGDTLATRVLAIRGADRSFIDLAPLGVGWIDDIIAAEDHLIVLERSLGGPVVERVLRVSYAGELIEEIAIPAEFGIDGFPQGLLDTGDDSRTTLRYLGPGPQAAEWDRSSQTWSFRDPIQIDGVDVAATDSNGDLRIGEVLLTVDAAPAQEWWASLRYLGHTSDGRWMTLRWDGVQGIEWWSNDGQFLGAATMPVGGHVEGSNEAVAATSDGRVFVMTTHIDAVRVSELSPQPQRIITP